METSGSLRSLLIGLFISLAFISVGLYVFKQEWLLNQEFLETTCKIIDKSLSSYQRDNKTYYNANFQVTYQVNNQSMTKWIHASLLNFSNTSFSLEQGKLDTYHKGQSYSCWYDPNDITTVSLERGYSAGTLLFLGSSLLVFILLAWALIKKRW